MKINQLEKRMKLEDHLEHLYDLLTDYDYLGMEKQFSSTESQINALQAELDILKRNSIFTNP